MKFCIPIRAKSLKESLLMLRKIEKTSADLVELWADTLSDRDVSLFLRQARRPVLVVCKGKKEKGSFVGSEKMRVEKLIAAVSAGARFVDVGLHTSPALIKKISAVCKKSGTELIISHHEWKRTPKLEKLLLIAQKAGARGANIIKIATFIKNWSDAVILFEVTKVLAQQGKKVVIVGMGPKSFYARLGGLVLGGEWTYAALDKKSATAAGQPTIKKILTLVD